MIDDLQVRCAFVLPCFIGSIVILTKYVLVMQNAPATVHRQTRDSLQALLTSVQDACKTLTSPRAQHLVLMLSSPAYVVALEPSRCALSRLSWELFFVNHVTLWSTSLDVQAFRPAQVHGAVDQQPGREALVGNAHVTAGGDARQQGMA